MQCSIVFYLHKGISKNIKSCIEHEFLRVLIRFANKNRCNMYEIPIMYVRSN